VLEAVSEVNGALYFGPTKTGQVRSVSSFPAFLRNLLTAHLTNFVKEIPDALVFTTQNDATPRIGNFRRRVWWPALDGFELPRSVRIHDLRHTCASMLIAGGKCKGHSAAPRSLIDHGYV
jgi:integrase